MSFRGQVDSVHAFLAINHQQAPVFGDVISRCRKLDLKHECDRRGSWIIIDVLSYPPPLHNHHNMAIFDKLKAKLDSNKGGSDNSFANNATCALPLGPQSVIRYRQQRGVNLGEQLDA